jgi:hypothetical protein
VALSAVLSWRGHPRSALACGSIGAVLILLGATFPDALRPVYRAWMGLALVLSRVTTPIFMGIVYFLVVTPIALVMRVFGYDPLQARASGSSRWRARDVDRRRSNLQRQF